MNRDLAMTAHRGNPLLGAAEIERAADAEAAQRLDIGFREVAQVVGSEDLPPADDPTVSGRVTAEIAKIAGAGEVKMTGRGV